MNRTWIFDMEHARRFSERRKEFLKRLLPPLVSTHDLKTALDAGCGIGFFASYLTDMALKVTALDARADNIAEAKRRYPDVEFCVHNLEDPTVRELGSFDFTFCLGLLYHLENPFQAIRNLQALTRKILLIETIVTPSQLPIAALVDECQGEDQSLRYIAFIPSEACLIKMLYNAGFPFVYSVTMFPEHEEFRGTFKRKRRRTMIIASKIELQSSLLQLLSEPPTPDLWLKGWANFLRMHRVNAAVPIYLPGLLYRLLRRLKQRIVSHHKDNHPVVNLLGDRDIEWSWIASQMPSGPGEALDFGPGSSHLGLIAAQRGFNVTAVDLEPVQWPYVHPQLRFVQGDILKLSLPKEHFDLVINCSTIEHVGLAGRYGVTEDRPDGDLEAMARLRELMKPGGVMLLTIPVGQDAVFAPLCRVYGAQRLPRLLEGYIVEKEVFWVKGSENRWTLCNKETALNFEASAGSWNALQNVYALGGFILRAP
jgi:2-polyprenyl-3-methyl-5-hydroxy-6-metoxy-1,4-benzoquinol methylase